MYFLDEPSDLVYTNNKEEFITSGTIARSEYIPVNVTSIHHDTTIESFKDEIRCLSLMTTAVFIDPVQYGK